MKVTKKYIAIYVRVSSNSQSHASQLPDLERWANAQETKVVWYRDSDTGRTMERDGWTKLEQAIASGKVSAVVVWRIDRLGRTARGLTALFDDLNQRKVNLVSLKDGLDLSTPAGRLMANVLASVAQYETEVRGERQRAGIAVAKAAGKYKGGKVGRRCRVTDEIIETVKHLHAKKTPIARIAKTVKLSRVWVYKILDKSA